MLWVYHLFYPLVFCIVVNILDSFSIFYLDIKGQGAYAEKNHIASSEKIKVCISLLEIFENIAISYTWKYDISMGSSKHVFKAYFVLIEF